MNDLTPITAKPNSLKDLAISTQLWELLSGRWDAQAGVEAIVADPIIHGEVMRVAPALIARAQAAGEDAVRRALQPLVLVYGVGEAARVPAFWQPYRILANLPPTALAAGIEDYISGADSQFFPKPGPLKALCERHAEPVLRAASRARRAADLTPPKPRPEPTEEDKAAVANMLAETLKVMGAKTMDARPQSANLPSTAGKPDEGGLTPAMRALMARRAGEGQ